MIITRSKSSGNVPANRFKDHDLNINCIQNILQFLPLKDLHSMSRTSKIISDYIPVDMIVKAALLNGGNSKTSIENIYPLIKKRCIHPLSASGLWEILQSNKCAICHNTVQRRGPRGNNSVRFAREGYGFNICWPCVRYAKLLLCNMFKCSTANIMKILNDPFLIYKDQMKLQY